MRVQVHGQVEALSQRGDQGARRGCSEQAGHVLDGQDVGSGVDDLLGQTQVVVEGVELLTGVREIAGVAQGDLGDCRPVSRTASTAGRIWLTSLSESKIRKMSRPVRAASWTKASVTCVG
jgi:hypothetical protein